MGERLTGRTVAITGVGGGIGSAIAAAVVEEGARVIGVDLSHEALERIGASLPEGSFSGEAADATDDEQLARAFGAGIERLGEVDVLFSNAGIAAPGTLEETDRDSFERVMLINAYSVIAAAKAALPSFERRGRGKIVNTCSVAGKMVFPGHGLYGASKYAVRALTQAHAKELGSRGVTVNAICPGMVETPIWTEIARQMVAAGEIADASQAVSHFASSLNVVLGRASTPADLTGLAVFLASDDSDYMTGQCINIDGGIAFD